MSAILATGHRDLTTVGAKWARGQIIAAVQRLAAEGATVAHCGLARGVDAHFGFAALGQGLALHAHRPYPQQADRWSQRHQEEWRQLWQRATERTTYGNLDGLDAVTRTKESRRLPHVRNRGMIDATLATGALAAIVVWDGRQVGGTWSAIKMLHRSGQAVMPIVFLDLAALEVRDGIPAHMLTPSIERH